MNDPAYCPTCNLSVPKSAGRCPTCGRPLDAGLTGGVGLVHHGSRRSYQSAGWWGRRSRKGRSVMVGGAALGLVVLVGLLAMS